MLAQFRITHNLRLPQATTWLAWLVPVFAWAQLTYPGYFEFNSGFLPIFNLNDLMRHLGSLSWAPTIGQPYDLLRGERSLPYYLAVVPRLLGVLPVEAVKWVFGASIVTGALGMYGWARRSLGTWPGLLAAAVYAFWPLGLATVYVRGAFAEAVLLGLMSWVLWAADAAVLSGRWSVVSALALGLAAVLWTQTGLALWLAVLTLVYILVMGYSGNGLATDDEDGDAGLLDGNRLRARRSVGRGLLGWAGGMGLGVLGLLPLILSRGLGGSSFVRFADHFVYPYQLLLADWGLGSSIPGPYDALTFQLGLVACGLALFSFLSLRSPASGSHDDRQSTIRVAHHAPRSTQSIAVAIVLVLTFLSTTLAAPLWQILPALARTLTYPWQLLLLAGPWLAWLAGLGGQKLLDLLPEAQREPAALPIFAGAITMALLGSYAYLNPPTVHVTVGEAPVAIFGDNEIALLSAETTGVPGPAGQVAVATRWQALRPLDRDYTVFFHVVGPDGTLWGQQDTMPKDGKLPTSQWRPGQVVVDQYQVTLKPDAPLAGNYRYLLGLYLWQTGERLSVGADDKVVLKP